LTESIRADFSSFSNIFVRLRILHPIVAGALGVWLLILACRVIASRQATVVAKRLGATIVGLVLSQFAFGIADIVLMTPTWLQLFHLFVADLLWMAFVLMASELLAWSHVEASPGCSRKMLTIDQGVLQQ